MDTLITLNDFIRNNLYKRDGGVEEVGRAISEIEKLRAINKIYQTLYSELPIELIIMIEQRIAAKHTNDAVAFNMLGREIEEYINEFRRSR